MLVSLGILAGMLGALMVWARTASPPGDLGLHDGRLRACPDSPNCVTSEDPSGRAGMSPWVIHEPGELVLDQLRELVRDSRGATLVTEGEGYLHAEFRTPLVGFVDDVEFRVDAAAGLVHFRSASRLGHSDLGVNRRRMEALGRRFADRR